MKTKHTPLPWYVSHTAGHDTHGQSAIYSEATDRTIAIVYDGDADGGLIAAAPELLEALAFYAESANWFGAPAPVYLDSGKLARAAIAKAEGQE